MDRASPELVARFEELRDVVPDADRKLVFGSRRSSWGGPCSSACTHLGCFVKLPPDAAGQLTAAGGTPFEPMPGRAMTGFFVLPATLPNPEQWVRMSYD